MTELNSLSLISSGQFPQLTDDVIDEIEDFLLYTVDSEISNQIYTNIIKFFQINLSNFIQSPNLSYVHQHYQKRLLRAMRFFRHSLLNFNLSRQLEEIAFSYLRSQTSSHTRQLAYVFLIDHFLTDPNRPPENCQQLISWTFEFINASLQNIAMTDQNFYLTLIYSIPNLYSLSPQSVNIPQFVDTLIKIAISGIKLLRQPNFSDDSLSIVVSKTLKLCSQLILLCRKISNETATYLMHVESLLSSDEISFSHIFQNYLLVACAIIQIDVPFTSDALVELPKKTIPFLVQYFPYFVQTPLLQSKKISFFLKTVTIYWSKTKIRPLESLPNLWNLVSSFHGHIVSITIIGDIIRNLISFDLLQSNKLNVYLFRDNPSVHHSLIENLVSSLEIVRLDIESIDFSKSNRPFETENWLECNKQIITLIYNMIQIDSMLMQKANTYYSTMRINSLVRFVKYICYLLDLAGSVANQNETESPLASAILHQIHLADFRDKMTYIFDVFVSTLMRLHQPLFNHIISLTMFDLLPKQQQRYFHKRVFTQFLKGPYLFDFQNIFFSTIADHFEELMLPTPPSILLMIIRIVFKTAFSDDSPLQIEQVNALCRDVYRFIIQAISSRNATLLELLLTMFHSYFQCKTKKFESLIQIISSSPFLMNNVLRILSEDPSLKDVVSFLSLFLFPLFNTQQQISQQQLVEQWVQLFLTSIESPNRISTAIPTLYNYTSRSFAQMTASLKEPIQSTFVSSLLTPLSKMPKEQNLKILLGKIPEIACRLSLQTQNPKKRKTNFVLVGGFQVDMEIIFEGIKRKPNPTENEIKTFFESYCQFLASIPFFEASSDSLVDRMTDYIQKNSPELLETMYQKFSPPTKYAALFLREKYCKSIEGTKIDDTNDFLQHIASLCYSRSTALPSLHIITLYLDEVDHPQIISKINSALLHAAQFDSKESFRIISTQILNRDFIDKPDLQNEIIQHFRLASMDIMTAIRRTAIKLLLVAEEKFKMNDLMGNYRQEVLKNISSIFQNQLFLRFQFIFTKPFTDVVDPISIIQKLMEFFRNKQIPFISKEVQMMHKKLKCTDIKLVPYLNAKFVIKMISRLIVVTETLNVQTWSFIIRTLKDDTVNNYRQFIPYLIKQLKKSAKQISKPIFNSLPTSISGLVSILGNGLPNTPEDIKLIRFLFEYSPFKIQLDQIVMQFRYPMKQQINMQAKQMQQHFFHQTKQETIQFIQMMSNVILSIQHSLPEINRNFKNQKPMIQETLKQVSKLASEIKPIIQKTEIDMSMLFQSFLDVLLFCKINLISIDSHFYYMFDAWPTEIIKVLAMKFQNMWNFDLFFVVLDILEHPKVPQFRQTLFDHLSQCFKNVFDYIKNATRDIEIVLSRSLNTLCNIVNNLEFHEFDLLQVVHLTKKILNKLKKKAFHIMKKSGEQPILPSLFSKYIQILLPLRFADKICSYPKIFNYFKTKVMISFITRPSIQLFQHPLFNRRLVDFMMLLEESYRNELYSLVPDPSESKSILVNQILCDRYRYFPEEVQIKVDFANYMITPSFRVLILNFSAALLASNKCVTLTDLKDTPILTSNSYTHALAIHYKLRNIDSIKTLSRFFPVIKMLSNIDSSELDAVKEALAERLDTTPYTNKSSLLLFRTLGQQNCVIDHSSRAITQYIMAFSTTILNQTFRIADSQFIFVMPHVFQHLLSLKPSLHRLFEILLNTALMVLEKMPDKTSMAQIIPTTMMQFLPAIKSEMVDSNLILSFKKFLMKKQSPEEMANQMRMKFLLQLIPVISKFLFDESKKKEEPKKPERIEGLFSDSSIFDFGQLESFNPLMSPTAADEESSKKDEIVNFFPYILLPNVFFVKNYAKPLHVLYQKALREAVISGGGNVCVRIIKEMYDYLRRIANSISQPILLSPFSTVSMWISEVTSSDLIENLKILLEALKPCSPKQLFIDLSCLRQPINQTVSSFILNMLHKDFEELIDLTSSINSIKPLTIRQSIDLSSDCWKIDWFSINVESHISVFLRLIGPKELENLYLYFNLNEMRSIVSIILNSTRLSANFPTFMKYYVHNFPKSSLSECFCTTTSFASLIPYPSLSLYSNIEFFESININEDALGLLKCMSKSFLNPASFLQLSQFRAAKYFFLKQMDEDQSHYFYGLSELRSIDINLSLHKCIHLRSKILGHRKENTFPVITLPFYPESFDSEKSQKEYGNRLTTFISKSHIPFLFRSSLEDEVYQYIKVMQQPESLKTYKLEELLRISSTAWIKALDRSMMMTSNFVWRLTILNDFLSNTEISQETGIIQQIQELIDTNRSLVSYLLSHSGATRDALSYYEKSPDNKCIYVSQQNYSRVCQFFEKQCKFLKAKEKVFSIPITLNNSPSSSSTAQNSSSSSFPFEKLRVKLNFLMKDFQKIELKNRKWLDSLFFIYTRHYDLIDQQNAFRRIIQDLNNSSIFDSLSHVSMILCMIKKNPMLINILSQEFASLKIDIRLSILRWLPQFICCIPDLPDDFIHNLIRTNSVIFIITFEDFLFSTISKLNSMPNQVTDFVDCEMATNLNQNMKKIRMMTEPGSLYLREKKMNKELQGINEYRSGMSWVQMCSKDIEKLNFTVKAHKFLYEYLARGEIPKEILSLLGFSNEKELILFCEKNPPVFKTDLKTNNYSSFSGFKFPSAKSILSIFIEKDNDSTFSGEAVLRYVTVKGESKMLQIVSPEIYGMSQRERLFVEFVGHLIEKNVASHTRSRSTYYPYSFLVHEHLLVTDSHQFSSLHSALQPISVIQPIVEASIQKKKRISEEEEEEMTETKINDDPCPSDFVHKKVTNLPNSLLLWWFLQGAEGSKIDFVFMRQSFASYYAVFSYFHFIFKSQIPPLPSIMLIKDRLKCCIPDFMNSSPPAVRFLTQTPQIQGFLPNFVMKGSFATSWQIVADSLCMNKDRIRVVLMALMIQLDPPSKPQIQDCILKQQQSKKLNGEQSELFRGKLMQQLKVLQQQNKLIMMKTSSIILSSSKIDRLAAVHMTEETEKCDEVFPFLFVEHLIDNSANVLAAQPIAFSWV